MFREAGFQMVYAEECVIPIQGGYLIGHTVMNNNVKFGLVLHSIVFH